MSAPEGLKYTAEHEWALSVESGVVRVGITAHAQESLGDIVFVTLPEVGTAVHAGESFGEIESTKSVSELYAPVSGTIRARNGSLEASPELVNTDPYGEGWIIEIDIDDATVLEALMDAAAYQGLIEAG